MAPERTDQQIDQALEHVNPAKRKFIKALVAGVGFSAPMVASFSMKGVSSYVVHAQVGSNLTFTLTDENLPR
jgi:hypothetical protein